MKKTSAPSWRKAGQCLFIATIAVIAGCSEKVAVEENKTVDYYLAHAAERKEFVAKCMNDAALRMTPNCTNARDATTR